MKWPTYQFYKLLKMPSFVPRREPTRKKEQLSQCELELKSALRKRYSGDKLTKFIENYRHSHIAYLKALIHTLKDKEFQKKHTSYKVDKIESEILDWEKKTSELILEEVSSKIGNIA